MTSLLALTWPDHLYAASAAGMVLLFWSFIYRPPRL